MLPERLAAKIFGQVIEALVCFHDQCIAHRDLKPENLMVLLQEGQEPLCKVIDFGFACKAT
jgi:serine/threonine protein kinase